MQLSVYADEVRTISILLVHAVLVSAQDSVRAGFAELNETRLRADLTFLTSPPLNGRLSLERGSDVAIHWIASEFAKAGLKAPVDGGYLQPVPLIEFRANREESAVTIRVKGEEKK